MTRPEARLAAAVGALLLSMPAFAQLAPPAAPTATLADLELEQLLAIQVDTVFGASRYEQKVSRAPASVSIVTADDIRRFGYRTLDDVLRSVRGLYITSDRSYSSIGIRGFDRPGDSNTHVLLLLDGHRLNDNLYHSAALGHEAIIDVDLIERVEVIRGPSSSIYGGSAFFGVINVVTKRGEAVEGVGASASAGSLGTYEGRASFGTAAPDGVEAFVSGTGFRTKGQDRLYFPELDTPENGNGVAKGLDGNSTRTALGRLAYRGFTVQGAYSYRDKRVPTGSFGTVFGDGREKIKDERIALDLSYSRALPGDTQLLARAFYDQYAYRADYPFDFAAPGSPRDVGLLHDDNRGDEAGGEVVLTKKISGGHAIVVGGEFRRDLQLRQRAILDSPYTVRNLGEGKRSTVGLYTQAEIAISSTLFVNAGIRYDHHDGFGSTFSPRLGLIYSPSESTTLKALYGVAYRAPNAFELYLEEADYIKANPSLRPDTVQTWELVVEQRLPAGLRAGGSVYLYDVDDLIAQVRDPADGLLVFRNDGSVRASGLELELDGSYASGFSFRASWALVHAKDERTELVAPSSPRNLLKLATGFPIHAGGRSSWSARAGVEAQYTSAMRTLAEKETSGVLILNATLSGRTPLARLDWSASVYNLLDTAYAHPGTTSNIQDVIPQDGRTFRAKLTYRF